MIQPAREEENRGLTVEFGIDVLVFAEQSKLDKNMTLVSAQGFRGDEKRLQLSLSRI